MAAAYEPLTLSWRARPGVRLALGGEGATELFVSVDDETTATLRPGATLARTLVRLDGAPGLTEDAIVADAGGGDPVAQARAQYAFARLVSNGLLVCGAWSGERELATLTPRRRDFAIQAPVEAGPEAAVVASRAAASPAAASPAAALPAAAPAVVLSRFAFIRRVGDALVLACPGAACELALHSDAGGWIAAAARPVDLAATEDRPAERTALLRLALAHGLLERVGATESPAEASWEFHDRLFHHAARSFDDLVVRGGTFRFVDRFPSPPAIRPPHDGETTALPAVAHEGRDAPRRAASGDEPLRDASAGDASHGAQPASASLRDVMDRRRSRREMSETPVSLAAVGELLWRVARTTGTDQTGPQQTIRRPYPSGGSLHELEFYLAVGACDGLAPGFHHYRGDAHELTRLPDADTAASAMLASAAAAWGQPGEPPQVLVVIAARLPRLAWKYSGIAYKISLLNAGVAIQSLYLVTTDLGLIGSAAGSGDPGLFAQATGCDPFEETSIAEFGFGLPADGVLPTDPAARDTPPTDESAPDA